MCYHLCIHINVVFQNCHPEKQNPDSNDALVQNILENFLSELSFESFASLTKTSISLLSIRILYQDSSSFFYSPELAINVSLKWWKWLKLTFKLWNLSPLRIFQSVYACVCVCYRLRKHFQKVVEILWLMADFLGWMVF